MPEFPIDPIADGMTAEGITRLCDSSLAYAQELAEQIRTLKDAPAADLTWDATLGRLDDIAFAVQESVCLPQLLTVAHPDPVVRQAASACEPKANAFITQLYMDADLAAVFKAFDAKREALSPIQARFLEHTLRDYKRNGLDLDAPGRERLRNMNEEITQLGQTFERNLAETTSAITVTAAQLAGLPPPFVSAHPADAEGKIRITTDYPDYVPFMQYAQDRTAARELFILSQNRAKEKNLPLLASVLALRKEKASLLGYPTWADYVLEPRMAKTAATVKTFLTDLHTSLATKALEEFSLYTKTAQELGMDVTKGIPASDASFLLDRITQKTFSLDTKELSAYFDVDRVRDGILRISSLLYGLAFTRTEAPAWHADVTAYDVSDERGLIGRVYLDLYPRDGKYKHAAVFPVRETRRLPDGSRGIPLGALVCNFPKPGAGPALLSHRDVVTFFHEFGHLLHHIISTCELASFAGTNVARDFVEAPSQMFEEWAWRRDTLDLFAAHHQTGERIPEDIFRALTASRTFGEAIGTQRQLFLATLDQEYHTREQVSDPMAIYDELYPQFTPFTRIPDTHMPATFGHLMGGYDASYYGYQWALSIARDLLTRFETEGFLNTDTARAYRDTVLAPGGSADENTYIEKFLGRPGNSEAYKKYLGT